MYQNILFHEPKSDIWNIIFYVFLIIHHKTFGEIFLLIT